MKLITKKLFITLATMVIATGAWAQNLVNGAIENVPAQSTYTPTFKSDGAKKKPLNIILMIGDGTGLAQWASGYFTNNNALTVMNLKALGLVTTKSASDYTTDSAASGTAYATGHKTYNYAVGVDVNKQPLENIPDLLSKYGIVSGIISTDDLDGATPASFFAHQPNRSMVKEIWGDMPNSKLIFFSAGHMEKMAEMPLETQQAIREKFTVVNSLTDPAAANAKRLGYLPPSVETQSMAVGRGNFLPSTTKYAMNFLKNHKTARKKGFFLMVEGARIDKSAHKNEYAPMVKEVLDFDKAIEEALRFADADGNTLVLISADHETGGLSIGYHGDPAHGSTNGNYVSTSHTPIPVPIFAYGPHSQDFMGVQGNDEVAQKIIKLLTGK